MKGYTRKLLGAAVAAGLVFTAAGIAGADTVLYDADTLTSGVQSTGSLTGVPGGQASVDVSFELSCTGKQHVDNGQTVTVARKEARLDDVVVGTAVVAASASTIGAIDASWPDDTTGGGSTNCGSGNVPKADNGDSTVTVNIPLSATPGSHTVVVVFEPTLAPSGAGDTNAINGNTEVEFELTVLEDTDGDLVADEDDNCPDDANPDQADDDNDGVGDVCDTAAPSDTTAPTGSVSINDGASYTSSSSVTLDLSASDAVGVVAVRYANGADCSAVSYASVTSSTSYSDSVTDHALASGDGTRGVCAQFKDEAGNESTTATDTIVVDTAAPTIASCAGGSFILNSGNGSQTVSIGASDPQEVGVDAVSGLDTAASTLSGTVNTTTVGSKSVQFTALDNAGNQSQRTCTYSVTYAFTGFSSPVDNPGWVNKMKAGQAVPLKWHLADANGVPVTNLSTATITALSFACATGATTDLVEEVAPGGSGLQNLGGGYYQLNWKTPTSYASSCKTMKLNLGEGTTHDALFTFTK